MIGRSLQRIRIVAVVVAAVTLAAGASPARSADVADFYKGRSINLIIGYSVGGGYDLYGRVLARHIGRHIPGNPSIVPQNMPGAGSLKSVMYLYSAAPKDGSVFGTFGRTEAVSPLFGGDAKFDATKLGWLGSVTSDTSTCVTWHASGIKSWDDMLHKDFTVGGLGAGADPDVFAHLVKNVFGAKLKLVTGYPGTNDVALAMERGEVNGVCGLSYSTLTSRHADWLREKKVYIIVQAALKKEPALPDVPLMIDLAKSPEDQKLLKLVLSSQLMARPFATPPGVPPDRLAALRKAFDETMRDPQFLEETRRSAMDVDPITGEAIESLLTEVYASPKDIVERAARATSN